MGLGDDVGRLGHRLVDMIAEGRARAGGEVGGARHIELVRAAHLWCMGLQSGGARGCRALVRGVAGLRSWELRTTQKPPSPGLWSHSWKETARSEVHSCPCSQRYCSVGLKRPSEVTGPPCSEKPSESRSCSSSSGGGKAAIPRSTTAIYYSTHPPIHPPTYHPSIHPSVYPSGACARSSGWWSRR